MVSNDDENSVLKNEKYEEEGKKDEAEGEEGIHQMDEFWDEEPGEVVDYKEERYGERSYEDEEAEEEGDAPPSDDRATISAAEKPEEEVQQDVVGPDHVLAEIPIEVRINLSFCVILPVELLCLTTFVIF